MWRSRESRFGTPRPLCGITYLVGSIFCPYTPMAQQDRLLCLATRRAA